jgi:membrane-associated protease RseP (regulator of RpoE activity)
MSWVRMWNFSDDLAWFKPRIPFIRRTGMLRLLYLVVMLGVVLGVVALAQNTTPKSETRDHPEALLLDTPAPLSLSGSYLGVFLEEVTPERKKDLGLNEERGAIVMKVMAGSPAEKAGLKENDVITSFNGRQVDSVRELQRLMDETPPGRAVTIEIIRSGEGHKLVATMAKRDFGDWSRQMAEANKQLKEQFSGRQFNVTPPKLEWNWGNFDFTPFSWAPHRLGVSGETVNGQLAEYFGVKGGHGVLVTEVEAGSPAAKAGLKAGDVIVAFDEHSVDDVNQLLSEINKKDDSAVSIKVVRDRSEITINVTLEKRSDSKTPPRTPRVRVLNRNRVI